ncbi:hypothetical protein GM50_14880 [freshwater metagenome]|uniref:Peroxide stress protein YaaA n=1 Tax=freshwater metagenome TaxID=449393 RepID=A0A094QNV7_9ZZZZ
MEPLWLNRCKGIRTPVRKLAPPTDIHGGVSPLFCPEEASNAQNGAVLILLPPSEGKNQTPNGPAPAISVYSGVLYKALDYPTLSASAKARCEKSVVIISAKYGAISPSDRIEFYKEKIINAVMRPVVEKKLAPYKKDLIIDCRSSTYQAVWSAPADVTVAIRASTVVDGERKVITHMSKKTRGEVTRALLVSRTTPKTVEDIYAIISEKFPCALTPPKDGEPWILEVIAI